MNTMTNPIKAHNPHLTISRAGESEIKTTNELRRCEKCGTKLARDNTDPYIIFLDGRLKVVCNPCYGTWERQAAEQRLSRPPVQRVGKESNWRHKYPSRKAYREAARLELLEAIETCTPANITDVTRQLCLTPQNVLNRIRCLEKSGHVNRVTVPKTGQQVKTRVRFVLTDKGTAMLEGVSDE